MHTTRLSAVLALCASLVLANEPTGTTTQTSTTTRTMTLTKCNPTMTNCPLKSAMPMESSAYPPPPPQSSASSLSAEVEPTEPLPKPTVIPSSILPPVAPEAPATSLVLSSSTVAPSPLTSSMSMMQPAKPMNQTSSPWFMPNSTAKVMPSGTGIRPSMMTTSGMPSETASETDAAETEATKTEATMSAPSSATGLATLPSGSAGNLGATTNLVAAAIAAAVAVAL
ncbi:hypothetical protein CDD82_7780 [Ophiocordyceps australis]|uniref:Uncharacterized protein n=1 Tax=Ophiocordyceps australis TaxID=1399860 RepID=A0A2C5YKW3_9HYPO|nr:hypothetical protein CDD82_7780 [Ophiocordyceps australis]